MYTIIYFIQELKYLFVYFTNRNKVHLSVQYPYELKQNRHKHQTQSINQYQPQPKRKAGNSMKNIISSFTQEELQLLYAACMSYGDKLSEIVKSIPNEDTNKLADRAKESWNMARKITDYMK